MTTTPEPEPTGAPQGEQFRFRRAPRYRPFVITGFVVGAVVGAVLALVGPELPKYSTGTQVGYLAMFFGLLGGIVGAAVAVVVERRSR
ncbi:MAG: hypothetical protein U0Q15_10145 [Kineosporiaceae bacterium]